MPSVSFGLSIRGQLNNSVFVPNKLFSSGEVGIWYDPSDITTLFQDSAGTIPVTATGQSVGKILDKSGRGNHATQATSTQCPIYGINPIVGIRNIAFGSANVSNATYWPNSSTGNGITLTKIASGIDTDGLPYVDVRYSGTAAGTVNPNVYSYISSLNTASLGQTYTASALLRVLSGSTAGVNGFYVSVVEVASGSYLTESSAPQVPTTSDTLSTVTRTLNQATVNQVRTAVNLTFTNGATIDVTYRIKGLQLELGVTRTAYQFSYTQYNVTQPGISSVSYLSFDGVDDGMSTSTITPGTDAIQVFAGLRKLNDTAIGTLIEASVDSGANSGTFALFAPAGASPSYSFLSRGTSSGLSSILSGYVAPTTNVISGIGKISTDTSLLRVNGAQVASNALDQGTGNFLAYQVYIGRRAGASNPINGRIYSLIARFGASLTTGQITSTETWVNNKTGAY